MNMPSNNYLKRAQRHGYLDGIAEILIGIGVMLYALFQMVRINMTDNEALQLVLTVTIAALVVFTGGVAFRLLQERIRENITYPRTGYVNLKTPQHTSKPQYTALALLLTPVFALLGVALAIVFMVMFALVDINGSLIILSAMLATPAVGIAWRTGLTRLYVLAGAIVAVGIVLTMTNTFGETGITLLYGLTGLLVSLSGVIAFLLYLRHYPHPNEEV